MLPEFWLKMGRGISHSAWQSSSELEQTKAVFFCCNLVCLVDDFKKFFAELRPVALCGMDISTMCTE